MLTLYYAPAPARPLRTSRLKKPARLRRETDHACPKASKMTPDYLKVNPRGKVPALE